MLAIQEPKYDPVKLLQCFKMYLREFEGTAPSTGSMARYNFLTQEQLNNSCFFAQRTIAVGGTDFNNF